MRTLVSKARQEASAESATRRRAQVEQGRAEHPVHRVQRKLSNHAMLRLLQAKASGPARIQPKLTINTPGDAYEQEADRIAEQVMRMPQPDRDVAPQTAPAGSGRLQTKSVQAGDSAGAAAPPIVHEVLGSPGQPLDAATRAFMEPRFGQDFGAVRVHTDARAAESARSIDARAYTVGRDIAFGAGEYRSETTRGRQLLAHELTHVAQQGGPTAVEPFAIHRQAVEDRASNADVKAVQSKYKTSPYTVDTYKKDWHLYVKQKPYVRDCFEDEGARLGIAPSELFTTAMGEGLGFFFDDGLTESDAVSGFQYLGTDHFSSEFDKYKKHLPNNFKRGVQFNEEMAQNEKKQIVKSAKFANFKAGITGFAAVYKFHREWALAYGNALSYGQPDADQLHFWTYYFFQRPNGAKSVLKNNGSWDILKLKVDKTSPHPAGIASKCYKRVATWRYVKSKGVFSS